MFGIFFYASVDLRRLLTDYGFKGHPLRKDFPLSGFNELFYDSVKKKVCYRPTNLAQAQRNFKFQNTW